MDQKPSAVLSESLLIWGQVMVTGSPALVAGERCTLEVVLALSRGLPAGHRVEAWTHFVSDVERPQCDDPAAPAHFSCDSDGSAVETFALPGAAVHGPATFFPYRPYAGFRLLEPARAGTRFVVRLRDAAMQTYEEPVCNVRFALLDAADGLLGYMGDACYEVIGGAAHRLRVVGPTCVDVVRPFRCAVVVCDRYGNKTAEPLDGLRFDLRLDQHAVPTVGVPRPPAVAGPVAATTGGPASPRSRRPRSDGRSTMPPGAVTSSKGCVVRRRGSTPCVP